MLELCVFISYYNEWSRYYDADVNEHFKQTNKQTHTEIDVKQMILCIEKYKIEQVEATGRFDPAAQSS